MEGVFRVEGNNVTVSEHAAGPWDASMQHGGAPTALVTWAAEQLPTQQKMQVARITVDLMRPVPVAPLTFKSEIVREGRKIQVCAVSLYNANGVEVVRASVLRIRAQDTRYPVERLEEPLDEPLPEAGVGEEPISNNFVKCVTLRTVRGGFMKPSASAIWFRADRPMVEGFDNTPAMRAALTSDFSNAVGATIDFRKWMYINADLTVTMARAPVGEWILLNSEMTLGPDGAGLAVSKLADRQGYFGRAIQCLVLEPR